MPPLLYDPTVIYYIFALLVLFPVTRILERAGMKPLYALLLVVPMLGFACCAGAMAFTRWRT